MATWIRIGNFADLDPTEGNTASENAVAALGSFDSSTMSFVTAFANDSNGDGVIWEDDLGGGETVTVDGTTSALDSVQEYAATVFLSDGSSFATTLGVVQLSNSETYIVPKHDTHLDSLSIQSIELTSVLVDDYDGMYASSAARSVDNSSIVCFAQGTFIETPKGPCAVEMLKTGDWVVTRDHGPQIVRWTRRKHHRLVTDEAWNRPVHISACALGSGIPSRDLLVSPQHRVVVGGAGQLEWLFDKEAFAPAKALVGLPGIRFAKGRREIDWIHFACDRHEVVVANGCCSEALLLGPMAISALSDAERRAVFRIFGPALERCAALNGPPARPILKVGMLKRRIEIHAETKGRRGTTGACFKTRDQALSRRLQECTDNTSQV